MSLLPTVGRFAASSQVGIVLASIDRTGPGIMSAKKHFAQLDKATKSSQMALIGAKGAAASFGRTAVSMGKGLGIATVMVAQFERNISSMAAIIGAQAVSEMDGLRQVAIDLSKQFPLTANTVSKGMIVLAQAGLTTNQIYQATPEIIALAQSTLEDFNTSAELVIKTTVSMGLSFADVERVTNSLQFAVNQSINSLETLKNAMKFSAPFAKQLGIELEDLLSVMMLTANAGLEAGVAGRSFSQALLQVTKGGQRGADEASKAMTVMINTMIDGGATMADITRVLENEFGVLSTTEKQQIETLSQMSDAQIAAVDSGEKLATTTERVAQLVQVFGVRGARVFGLLLGQSDELDRFRTNMEFGIVDATEQAQVALDNLASTAMTAFNQMVAGIMESDFAKTLNSQLQGLMDEGVFENIGDSLGDLVNTLANEAIPILIDFIQLLNTIGEASKGPLGVLFETLGAVLKVVSSLIEGVSEIPFIGKGIIGLVVVLGTLEKLFGAITLARGVWRKMSVDIDGTDREAKGLRGSVDEVDSALSRMGQNTGLDALISKLRQARGEAQALAGGAAATMTHVPGAGGFNVMKQHGFGTHEGQPVMPMSKEHGRNMVSIPTSDKTPFSLVPPDIAKRFEKKQVQILNEGEAILSTTKNEADQRRKLSAMAKSHSGDLKGLYTDQIKHMEKANLISKGMANEMRTQAKNFTGAQAAARIPLFAAGDQSGGDKSIRPWMNVNDRNVRQHLSALEFGHTPTDLLGRKGSQRLPTPLSKKTGSGAFGSAQFFAQQPFLPESSLLNNEHKGRAIAPEDVKIYSAALKEQEATMLRVTSVTKDVNKAMNGTIIASQGAALAERSGSRAKQNSTKETNFLSRALKRLGIRAKSVGTQIESARSGMSRGQRGMGMAMGGIMLAGTAVGTFKQSASGNMSNKQLGGAAMGGAASGAMAGAMFGPWGMAIGAATGAITTIVGDMVGDFKRAKEKTEMLADFISDPASVVGSDTTTQELAMILRDAALAGHDTAGLLVDASLAMRDVNKSNQDSFEQAQVMFDEMGNSSVMLRTGITNFDGTGDDIDFEFFAGLGEQIPEFGKLLNANVADYGDALADVDRLSFKEAAGFLNPFTAAAGGIDSALDRQTIKDTEKDIKAAVTTTEGVDALLNGVIAKINEDVAAAIAEEEALSGELTDDQKKEISQTVAEGLINQVNGAFGQDVLGERVSEQIAEAAIPTDDGTQKQFTAVSTKTGDGVTTELLAEQFTDPLAELNDAFDREIKAFEKGEEELVALGDNLRTLRDELNQMEVGVEQARVALVAAARATTQATVAAFVALPNVMQRFQNELNISGAAMGELREKLRKASLFQELSSITLANERNDIAKSERRLAQLEVQLRQAEFAVKKEEIDIAKDAVKQQASEIVIRLQQFKDYTKSVQDGIEVENLKNLANTIYAKSLLGLARAAAIAARKAGQADEENEKAANAAAKAAQERLTFFQRLQQDTVAAPDVTEAINSFAAGLNGMLEKLGLSANDLQNLDTESLINKVFTNLDTVSDNAALFREMATVTASIAARGTAANAELDALAKALGITAADIRVLTQEELVELANTLTEMSLNGLSFADASSQAISNLDPLGAAVLESRDKLISMGISASGVDTLLEKFQQIKIFNSVLGFLSNFQGLANVFGTDLALGDTIVATQRSLLAAGEGVLDSLLSVGSPQALAEIFAKQNYVNQQVNRTTTVNLEVDVIIPPGLTAADEAAVANIATEAVRDELAKTDF